MNSMESDKKNLALIVLFRGYFHGLKSNEKRATVVLVSVSQPSLCSVRVNTSRMSNYGRNCCAWGSEKERDWGHLDNNSIREREKREREKRALLHSSLNSRWWCQHEERERERKREKESRPQNISLVFNTPVDRFSLSLSLSLLFLCFKFVWWKHMWAHHRWSFEGEALNTWKKSVICSTLGCGFFTLHKW